jgi:hypothetical protein
MASDFLAECFLLPLDEWMLKQKIPYLRYVDDIRIFARTKIELQERVIKLEQWCKNCGLIPHGDKHSLGTLPSIRQGETTKELEQEEAEDLFKGATEGRPLRIKDRAHIKYVLFRAPRSRAILRQSLLLIERHPEMIDAFTAYFSNYITSASIEKAVKNMLKGNAPYAYVRGELWQVLARMGSQASLAEMLPLARRELSGASCVSHQWGLFSFLLACHRKGMSEAPEELTDASELVQAFVMPAFTKGLYEADALAIRVLHSKDYHPGLGLISQLAKGSLSLSDISVQLTQLPSQVQHSLHALGLLKQRRNIQVDQIGEALRHRYNTPCSARWKRLLGREYDHALNILRTAEGAYGPHRSVWLQNQNSFNDIVVRKLLEHLSKMNLPGGMKTVDKHGNIITVGNLLDRNKAFFKHHPCIAGPMKQAHDRRSSLPGSHPYTVRGGAQSKYLEHGEQKYLHQELEKSYMALVLLINNVF